MKFRGVSQNPQARLPMWEGNPSPYMQEKNYNPGDFALKITQSSMQHGGLRGSSSDRIVYSPLGSVPRGSPGRPGSLSIKHVGTMPPLAPQARTATMRDMEDAVDRLRSENESLKVELHRLRKIEAGWFPPRDGSSTNVNVYNNYEQRINQYIDEVNVLRQELMAVQAENANLYAQLQRADEGLANELRARLAQAQFENSSMVAEMQRLNQVVESERSIVVDLRDQLERMRNGRAREIQDAEDLATRDLKATIGELRMENRRVADELEGKSKLILTLEARIAASATHGGSGDSAAKDRDRIIEHYKLKWDEIRKDNARLRALLLAKEEEIQRIMTRFATEPPSTARQEQERALAEAFKAEIAQLRNELDFYKQRKRPAEYENDFVQEDVYEEVNVHHDGGREVRSAKTNRATHTRRTHESDEGSSSGHTRRARPSRPSDLGSPPTGKRQRYSSSNASPFASSE